MFVLPGYCVNLIMSIANPSLYGYRLQAAFWLVLLLFTGYLSSLALGWPQGAYRTLLVLACHLVNFYVCYSFLVPRFYEQRRYVSAFAGLVLLLLLLTPLRDAVEQTYVMVAPLHQQFGPVGRIGFVLFTELIIAAVASLLRLAVSHEQNKQHLAALEKLQLEAELRFLKAQMNPHFLFNTINNIYALALQRSEKTADALLRLSGLLRYLLYESNGPVTLAREAAALQAYADLFRLRYEQPVDLKLDIPEHLHAVPVEPLLLIPLLENILKHAGLGVDPRAFGRFTVAQHYNRLVVSTHNSHAAARVVSEASGIGLPNIRRRLDVLYGEQATLVTDDRPDGFSLTLTLPLT